MKRGGDAKRVRSYLFLNHGKGWKADFTKIAAQKKNFFFLKNKFTTKQFLLLHLFQLVWY